MSVSRVDSGSTGTCFYARLSLGADEQKEDVDTQTRYLLIGDCRQSRDRSNDEEDYSNFTVEWQGRRDGGKAASKYKENNE